MTTTTEVKNMRGDETVAELRELAKVLFARARAERKARQGDTDKSEQTQAS